MASNKGLVSQWYHNDDSLNKLYGMLKEGDLLEFDRILYRHWAICVKVAGKRTVVVHRSASSTTSQFVVGSYSINKKNYEVGSIIEEVLAEVLGEDMGHSVRINNRLDNSMEPLAAVFVVKNAYMYMANEDEVGEYNVASNNCEHFATLCRYGKKKSQQVDTAKIVAAFAGAVAAVGSIAYLVGSFLTSGKSSKPSSDDDDES